MNIAGVLVHAYPGQSDTARAALADFTGIEVHHETDDERFIITITDTADACCDDTIMALQNAPGIASATLTYHSFEPEDPNQESAGPAAVTAGQGPGV